MKQFKQSMKYGVGGALLVAGQSAFANIAATDITAIETAVLATVALAAAAGVAIMVVTLGWDVGFNLVRKYVKKGAR